MVKKAQSILRHWVARCALSLFVCNAAKGDELQLLWQIPAGEGELVGTANNERGVAYNPVTGHVLLVSRTGGNNIYILNGETGANLGNLNLGDGVIAGGTFQISMIGVSDDGVIYVGNLSTSTTAPNFRLYRWESESAEAPTVAFEGDPAGLNNEGASNNPIRWGDSLDVRGAGVNTQVLLGPGGTSTPAAILTTENGTDFTATLLLGAAESGAFGVAFGQGNTFWVNKSGLALRQVSFDLEAGTTTLLRTVPTSLVPTPVSPIAVNAASNWLAGINIVGGADELRLYDISDPDNFFIIDQESFPTENANGNGVGSADFSGDILVALDTNNGLVAYRIVESVTPPEFVSQPVSASVFQGALVNLSANVSGTRPIQFRWQFDGADVPNATNDTLAFTNIAPANAGSYVLIASNSAGSITSSPVTVSVEALVQPGTLELLWDLVPGSRPYITSGNFERGLAYNPANGHVLLVSRAGGSNSIVVLNGDTGAELGFLQVPSEIVTGGTFVVNMIAIADDGAVYVANLDTAGSTYAIYRWENDSADTIPTVAWAGPPVPSRRWGDTFAARGSGVDTQLLAASNGSATAPENIFAVFTTTDGANFNPIPIYTDLPFEALRLGVAFGEGNSIWGTSPAHQLRQVGFDLATGVGTVLRTVTNVPQNAAPLGTQPATPGSSKPLETGLLGIVAFQTPDTFRLYGTSGPGEELPLIDAVSLPRDNANGNGVGSVTFAEDRVFVLNTNNGIQAYRLNEMTSGTAATLSAADYVAGTFSFLLTGSPNSSYQIQSTTDFSTWTDVRTVTTSAGGTVQVTDATTAAHRFYRAVAQ